MSDSSIYLIFFIFFGGFLLSYLIVEFIYGSGWPWPIKYKRFLIKKCLGLFYPNRVSVLYRYEKAEKKCENLLFKLSKAKEKEKDLIRDAWREAIESRKAVFRECKKHFSERALDNMGYFG